MVREPMGNRKRQQGVTGKAIRRARQRKSLSIEGLAFLAGVGTSTIYRIENGEVEPRRSTLAVINQAIEDYDPAERAAA